MRGYISLIFGPENSPKEVIEIAKEALPIVKHEISSDLLLIWANPESHASQDIQRIIGSSFPLIADVSGKNANVMWAIGYAEAIGKPVVLMAQDVGDVPHVSRARAVVLYTLQAPRSHSVARLADAVVRVLQLARQEVSSPSLPSSPIRRAFLSYSHNDVAYLDRLLVHLRPVERKGLIDLWSDTRIRPGDRWREEIDNALRTASVAVLLVSADFLASDFIVDNELPPLLAAAQSRGTRIIPVILKPSRFLRDENLSQFQALNDPARPLVAMSEAEREGVFAKLAEFVELEVLSRHETSSARTQ